MAFNLNTGKFKLVGGTASLDFVNTVSGRISNPNRKNGRDYLDFYRSDKLEDYADLLAWSFKSELVDKKEAKRLAQFAEREPQTAEKVFKRALTLRESIYRLFKSTVEGWQPEAVDLERFNRELSIASKHQRFSAAENGFVFECIDRENALDTMLWQISESTAETLLTADLTRIRQCGADACNRLFLDTSRNRSRNWCDMKECGNLAKVRRFRQRHQRET